MVTILNRDNPLLRKIAKVVPVKDVKSAKIKKIIRDMKTALDREEDGVAIAAPQIGANLRIFIVSPKVFDIVSHHSTKDSPRGSKKHIVCINPVILKLSKEKAEVEEGCLSVRYFYGNVARSKQAKIRALDENGKVFEMGGSGLIAQIFQHETDHLDGVLFTDKAKDLVDMPPAFAEATAGKPENNLKIAFFGTPELTTVILDSLKGNNLIPELVVTAPDMPVGRGLVITPSPAKIWAMKENISYLQPEKIDLPSQGYGEASDNFIDTLKKENFDLFVVVAYGKILPEKLINLPKYGTINVHYSLLPKYRGATPVESAILNGDTETGVCVQKMQFKLDTGPIISEEKIKIPENITAMALRDILNKKAAEILPNIIEKYVSGKIKPVPQEENLASICKKIKKEDGLIDIHGDAVENDRKFRAYSVWPRTYFFVNGVRVIISSAKFENGAFKIEKVIPEGKKEMLFSVFSARKDL